MAEASTYSINTVRSKDWPDEHTHRIRQFADITNHSKHPNHSKHSNRDRANSKRRARKPIRNSKADPTPEHTAGLGTVLGAEHSSSVHGCRHHEQETGKGTRHGQNPFVLGPDVDVMIQVDCAPEIAEARRQAPEPAASPAHKSQQTFWTRILHKTANVLDEVTHFPQWH